MRRLFGIALVLVLAGLVDTLGAEAEESGMQRSMAALAAAVVPPLASGRHKGQAGRIAILGGSKEYTGAPYYAGVSSLKAGGDLAWVLCQPSASVAIKSYSPELIVIPALSDDEIGAAEELLDRVHALVVGPGLGRDANALSLAGRVVRRAKALDLPVVLDGDALFLLAQDPDLVRGYANALLTPNRAELARLYRAVLQRDAPSGELVDRLPADKMAHLVDLARDDEAEAPQRAAAAGAAALASAMGNVLVLQKGPVDVISDGKWAAFGAEEGSPRRCGGQGDVLAGTSGLWMHWARQADAKPIVAAFAASGVTRRASKLAFARHKRGMTTPDMIDKLAEAMEELYPVGSAAASDASAAGEACKM